MQNSQPKGRKRRVTNFSPASWRLQASYSPVGVSDSAVTPVPAVGAVDFRGVTDQYEMPPALEAKVRAKPAGSVETTRSRTSLGPGGGPPNRRPKSVQPGIGRRLDLTA